MEEIKNEIVKAIDRQTVALLANHIFDNLAKGGVINMSNRKTMVKRSFEAAKAFIEEGFEEDTVVEEKPAFIMGSDVN